MNMAIIWPVIEFIVVTIILIIRWLATRGK